MKNLQHIFFDREDLLEKLKAIKTQLDVKFIVEDILYDPAQLKEFYTVEELDQEINLGFSKVGSSFDVQLSIVPMDEKINLERRVRIDGVEYYSILHEQLNFVEFTTGGIFNNKFLVNGRLAATNKTAKGQENEVLYNSILKIIKRNTSKYDIYLIGLNAYKSHIEGDLYLVHGQYGDGTRVDQYIYLDGTKTKSSSST